MQSISGPPTMQSCPTCGAGAPFEVHFCPQCEKILPLRRGAEYYSFFELPRMLNLDLDDLERRFRALSRRFHPDYFYNASPTERRASLERSSYLNDAYRVLRQPASRVEYLLGLEAPEATDPREPAAKVPRGLLEEVFSLNEELDEVRAVREAGAPGAEWRDRLERARRPIERKRADHERQLEELSAHWDDLVTGGGAESERRQTLQALRECVLERNYLKNLLTTIARELDVADR